MASENITLKLLVHTASQKVLYAEAQKEFVDFLVHLFDLPLGPLIHLVGSTQMDGCLGKLKESIETLNQVYFQPGINKDNVIKSKPTFNGNTFRLQNDDKPATPTIALYTCNSLRTSKALMCLNASENRGALCPNCGRCMIQPLNIIGSSPVAKEAEGKLRGDFVKDVVTYMVMDDLVVKPLSTNSTITFLNSCGVKDLSELEEKTLNFGEYEALRLLKASLSTDAVLTTLLQQKKIKREG